MSIYDNRTGPAYGDGSPNSGYANNQYILRWWTSEHDTLLQDAIRDMLWYWYLTITDRIVAITEPKVIEEWQNSDPICSDYAWYNVLMNFSIARAYVLGYVQSVRKPEWKTCPLCSKRFLENSLPFPLIERIGVNHINYCAPCLKQALLDRGYEKTQEQVIHYLVNLADTLQRVPSQGFYDDRDIFWGLNNAERTRLLEILREKPSTECVKHHFKSWFEALIAAGVLEEGTQKTSRGIRCLALDGHICFSLGEKTIDDLLFYEGIAHQKEVQYPEGHYRTDFLVDDTYVEYFGLAGNSEYDTKIRIKRAICKNHGIKLVEIYPRDLETIKKLRHKLINTGILKP
ncbi:MAG: hypothetical protein DPW16_19615 [Chloroflexi bacterium]|nr:hypothetical protein [Chloroflexota bacterium]